MKPPIPEFAFLIQERGKWPLLLVEQLDAAAYHISGCPTDFVVTKVRLIPVAEMEFVNPVSASLREKTKDE